jgi:hypothetical protein
MIAREHQWAVELKKAQRKTGTQAPPISSDQKKTEVQSQLTRTTQALDRAIDAGSYDDALERFRKMVELRASLIAIAIQEEKELMGTIEPTQVQELTRRFYEDCAVIAAQIDERLNARARV